MDSKKHLTVDDEIAYNNYKLTADKILQLLSQIREDPSASAKRWVWELLQNAKDVPNRFGKVSVEIELVSPDTLKFRHNGDCFSTKNITGLVQQVSSKDSQNQEGQTGKFGTGFICTHLLSDIIDVEGIVSYMGIYRRFAISLDRSGYRSEDLLPRIASTLEKLRRIETTYPIVDNYEANRTEESFDTVFTYHLTTEEKQKSAIAGLEDLINTLPVTLVTQSEKIKQVRVINRLNGSDVVYTCNSEDLDDNVRLSKIVIGTITKTYISYITDDVALTTEVTLNNGKYDIVKRDNKQPVLYRDFPLIGSEKFYFPYTLNGFEFNPTERRNGLLLNSADHPSCISNRQIVDKSIDAVFKFNEWLIIHNATNRYLLASSRIPESSEKYSDDIAAPWIKNLQLRWRKQLLDEKLVETDTGVEMLRNLSVPAFSTTATKEINERFFNLLHGKYIGRGVLPKFEHLHGWLEVIRPEYDNWETKLKYEKDDFLTDLAALHNLSALCLKINRTESETLEWLNKIFKFLVDLNLLGDFDEYAIIPNQKGEFKFLEDLNSDHSSRIPEILKSIYNSVNQDNATVQAILMNASIDATVFGNTLKPFSLKEMIEVLNSYVKQGSNIYKNNTCVDVKSVVAHSLLSLYPNVDDAAYIRKRHNIYEFCKAYRNMPEYSMVNITETDLWKEADNYWFNNSYSAIKANIFTMASTFFVVAKTEEETLAWLNTYLQFYRDNSHGDLIKEQAVFPNQQKSFKKLSELRYDCSIPEEFKDLANRAYNPNSPVDVYRHQLLHKAILGYEQHNPLTIKDVYAYVKKRFDDSNDYTKEAIARHTITIIAKHDSGVPEEHKLYDFAKTISGFIFEEAKYIETATGFNWEFAQEYYIKLLAQKIANSVNLKGFKGLSYSFTAGDNVMWTADLTHWIDRFIEFIHNYKTKKYWSIITDKDNGIGIWLNQNNNFCRFQDVRKDDGISEDLKNLCANNAHIKRDFREEMFTLNSNLSGYLETTPITLKELGEYVDDKLEHYDGNKQDNEFRSLVFTLGKLCNTIVGLEGIMTFFNKAKPSLIVWSLGEGTTMDLVGSIVQQGDEKLRAVKELLEGNSIEDLNNIKTVLQGCPATQLDKVKYLVEKLASENTPDIGGETPTGGEDRVEAKVELIPQTYEIEVIDSDGNRQLVRTDQVQYAGLSLEEIDMYVSEAKAAVVKYYKELNNRNPELGLQFDDERIASHSYSQLYGISDKNGIEIPIVVHSYKGPQYRYFDLNWYDWQLLSKPGAELWVLTVTGLQCIPLYALPVRRFSFDLENMSHNSRAILQTLAAVGKKSLNDNNSGCNITFDFGNVMPTGFLKRCYFSSVPEQLENCVDTIKQVCEANVPQIAHMYNSGKCIPIRSSAIGYSRALREVENDITMAELFEAQSKENYHPATIGTTHID